MSAAGEEHQVSAAAAAGDWAPPERPSGGLALARREATDATNGEPAATSSAALGEVGAPTRAAAAGVAVAAGDAAWDGTAGVEVLDSGNPLEGVEPVGVGGVLDGGFDLLRVGFGRMVGLAAALLLPLQLLELVVQLATGFDGDIAADQSSFAALGALGATSGPAAWIFVALRAVVLSFLGLTAGLMVRELLEDRLPSGRRLTAMAARRWWVAALVPVMAIPIKSLGACLVYVGYFLLDALVMCSSVVAGAEGVNPARAIGRSWTLARSGYGTAIGVSVGGFVISVVLQITLLVGPLVLVSMFGVSEGFLLAVQQITSLVLLIAQPLTACIAARLYVELRCRAEGLDLERRRIAQGLVEPGATAPVCVA